MSEETYTIETEEMATDRENKGTVFTKLALAIMGITALAIVLIAFLPVITVNDTAYCGWKVAFYYWGIQYIYDYYEFGFNAVLASALVLPVLMVLISAVMWRKASLKKKIVLQIICAGLFIFCAVAYFNAAQLIWNSCSDTMYQTIYSADKSSKYLLAVYPKVSGVICIAAAAAEMVLAVFGKKQQ